MPIGRFNRPRLGAEPKGKAGRGGGGEGERKGRRAEERCKVEGGERRRGGGRREECVRNAEQWPSRLPHLPVVTPRRHTLSPHFLPSFTQGSPAVVGSPLAGAGSAQAAGAAGASFSQEGPPGTWDPHKEIASLAKDLSGEANKLVLLEPIGQGGFGTGETKRGRRRRRGRGSAWGRGGGGRQAVGAAGAVERGGGGGEYGGEGTIHLPIRPHSQTWALLLLSSRPWGPDALSLSPLGSDAAPHL